MKLTTHLCPVLRLRTRGSLPPLPCRFSWPGQGKGYLFTFKLPSNFRSFKWSPCFRFPDTNPVLDSIALVMYLFNSRMAAGLSVSAPNAVTQLFTVLTLPCRLLYYVHSSSNDGSAVAAVDCWRLRPLRRTITISSRRTNSLFAHANGDAVRPIPISFDSIGLTVPYKRIWLQSFVHVWINPFAASQPIGDIPCE